MRHLAHRPIYDTLFVTPIMGLKDEEIRAERTALHATMPQAAICKILHSPLLYGNAPIAQSNPYIFLGDVVREG